MKKIFNIIITLIFVMTTGCTSLSLSLHNGYNNSNKVEKINNTQDAKLFCEAVHKDRKLDSSKTAIENCMVTAGLVTTSRVEQNKKYKKLLWWTLGVSILLILVIDPQTIIFY